MFLKSPWRQHEPLSLRRAHAFISSQFAVNKRRICLQTTGRLVGQYEVLTFTSPMNFPETSTDIHNVENAKLLTGDNNQKSAVGSVTKIPKLTAHT